MEIKKKGREYWTVDREELYYTGQRGTAIASYHARRSQSRQTFSLFFHFFFFT